MKGAMLYVNAGKGHYVPAKALGDSFIRAGHEAIVEDLFVTFNTPFWEFFCKYDWRFLLHHPRLEPIVHSLSDTRLSSALIKMQALFPNHLKAFKAWYENNKPDFIISTNFIGGIILPSAVRKLGLDVPVYQYCADVFDTPRSGVSPRLDRMYLPTELGIENAIRKGQPENTLSICPFPLREQFETYTYTSKEDVRKKLGLPENKFTILCSLGGEGIGSTHLLYGLAKAGVDCQVVVIGGQSKTTTGEFEHFAADHPDFPLFLRGFVDNVQEYLAACDMQVGKAGANAVMEAIYMKRPFIVTEVLYAFRASIEFLNRHEIGWCENDTAKQVEIIQHYISDESFRQKVSDSFDNLPIQFGSEKFRDLLIEDTAGFKAM